MYRVQSQGFEIALHNIFMRGKNVVLVMYMYTHIRIHIHIHIHGSRFFAYGFGGGM